MFTLSVSADQLEAIRAILPQVAEKAKPVRKPAPRRAAIKWQAPGLPALKPLKVSEIDAAEKAWNDEVTRARVAVGAGLRSAAEIHLRDLIALHYPEAVTS